MYSIYNVYIHYSVSLYVSLSISLCLSLRLSLYVSLYLSMSLCLSLRLSLYLSLYVSLYVSLNVSLYVSLYLSLYVSLSISVSLCLFLRLSLHGCLSFCLSPHLFPAPSQHFCHYSRLSSSHALDSTSQRLHTRSSPPCCRHTSVASWRRSSGGTSPPWRCQRPSGACSHQPICDRAARSGCRGGAL